MQAVWFSVWMLLFVGVNVIRAQKKPKDDPFVQPLPSYVKRPCYRDDPKAVFDKCVVEVGVPAIKAVVQGDPKYKIPTLDPLVIKELRIKQGTKQVGLELTCRDCKLWNLQNTKFINADVDWKKRTCSWNFALDKMKMSGKYNVTGQVLLLPIVGNGEMVINLGNATFSWNYAWNYEKKKNGYTYFKLVDNSFPFDVTQMNIHLENLFNGDKLLGGNMNRFLNEHWREIIEDLKPELSRVLAELASTILGNMAKVVPLEILFPLRPK